MGRYAQLPMLLILLVGMMLGLSACQSFNVRSDWDPTRPLADFERYFWLEPPEVEGADPFADNTLLRKRVRAAVEAELARRGFAAVSSREAADFLVSYSVILEERIRVDGYSTGAGYGYRSRYYGFGSVYTSANVRNFQESTLIIDFLDPANEDLVWRGWGTGIIGTRDRDRGQKRLDKGVNKILEAFPPNRDGD